MRKELKIAGAVGLMGICGATSVLAENVAERFGYLFKDNSSNTNPTLEPEPTSTPTPSETPNPSSTPTPTLELTPTNIPTSTSTPESHEGIVVENVLRNGEGIKSDFPAFINKLGNESTGVTLVGIDRFKDYFLQRLLKKEAGDGLIQRLDRMFGQLSLPVDDLKDRDLNFDWRNEGQGLGFGLNDLDNLKTLEEVVDKNESISRRGEDYRYRAWIMTDARGFDSAVLAMVDEKLRIDNPDYSPMDPSVQATRRALFESVVYGDWGVQAEDDGDERWETVNDKFEVCETHTVIARVRSEQSEALRNVLFDPDQEISGNNAEEETIKRRDSDNSVLVAMVYDPVNKFFRVEAYDLSNPPDPLNPNLDPVFPEGNPVSSLGGRWLPCGLFVPTQTHAPNIPENIPTPPVEYPTPVPTNVHRVEEHPEESDQPDRPVQPDNEQGDVSTQIP
jgi:hypothetical protein